MVPTLPISDAPLQIKLSEVIGALSYALDITEGQPMGHSTRTCMLGMRISRDLGMSIDQSSALFYALLLKDLGCSSNASKICYLFGSDDRAAKRDVKTVDHKHAKQALKYIFSHIAPRSSLFNRGKKLFQLAMGVNKTSKELVALRCERGARIAAQMQMPTLTAGAIRALDEHWDGMGHPDGLVGEQIPLLARVLGLAQTVEVFVREKGLDAAMEMAVDRSGKWFDPELVRVLQSFRNDSEFWKQYNETEPRLGIASFEPSDKLLAADSKLLDCIALGFAQVIDAKSPWTFRHSEGVAEIAVGIADVMGYDFKQRKYLRRAALLHDVGKLGISNMILDKPGKLTNEEFAEVKKHTKYTYDILTHVAGFRDLADLAASHHERLDGKGYHRGLNAAQLSTPARILCVADMYEALAAKRPYRQDLSAEEVMTILTKNMISGGICPEVFEGLKTWLAASEYQPTKIAA